MTGAKTNERPGTRAQVRYLRVSPFKARIVLDLIRGKQVGEASQILAFSERGVSREISKVLQSAVANAEHNDEIPAEELFVSACFADEGPTLKRFRPRARGRAGKIAKRTCHITVIVSRLSDDELDTLRSRAASRGVTRDAAASRRDRVARSRGDVIATEEPAIEEPAEEIVPDVDAEATIVDEVAAEATRIDETPADETPADEAIAEAEADEAPAEDTTGKPEGDA